MMCFKTCTKPCQRIVVKSGIKFIVHLDTTGTYVLAIQIDFGTPKYLTLNSKMERKNALSLLGMADYVFWEDSDSRKAMISDLEKEICHVC